MLEIKQATRQSIKALIGMYGKSGGGKTLSALLIARGLVGDRGRISLVDTENGRGSLFADIVPGGYQVIELDAPFSPDRYVEAIELAEKSSDVIVVDSMSHEWSGDGGVLDWQEEELTRMAGDNYSKREACKMAAWIKPKQAHKKFIMRLLRIKCGIICCLRGEEKTHMQKGMQGEKTKVITDEFSTPLFDQRFIFEMLINFECVAKKNEKTGLMEGGFVIPRKITHPTVAPFLPREEEQIGITFGQSLSSWCNAGGKPVNPSKVAERPATATEKTRQWMVDELQDIKNFSLTYAIDKGIIMPDEGLEHWPLSKVPTSKKLLQDLRLEIIDHNK